jgi:Zn finger protein HypA/HybF involved in hydrogenase expression
MIENSQVLANREHELYCECETCNHKCKESVTHLDWRSWDEPLEYSYICEKCTQEHYKIDENDQLVVKGE